MAILNITTPNNLWMLAFYGSVRRCHTQSLVFSDLITLCSNKEVGTNVMLNYRDQAISWLVHLEGPKTGVLSCPTKWSKRWRGWVNFWANVHCKLQGCQLRKYSNQLSIAIFVLWLFISRLFSISSVKITLVNISLSLMTFVLLSFLLLTFLQ